MVNVCQCDRCGAICDDKAATIGCSLGIDRQGEGQVADLCKECLDALMLFLGGEEVDNGS